MKREFGESMLKPALLKVLQDNSKGRPGEEMHDSGEVIGWLAKVMGWQLDSQEALDNYCRILNPAVASLQREGKAIVQWLPGDGGIKGFALRLR